MYQLAIQAQRRRLGLDGPSHVFSPVFLGAVFFPKHRNGIPPPDKEYPCMGFFAGFITTVHPYFYAAILSKENNNSYE